MYQTQTDRTQATRIGEPAVANVAQDTPGGSDIDVAAARRWAAEFRRIDRVEFISSRDGTAALIHGVGHRTPVTRRVPRPVGLGLVALGYRSTLRERSD